MSIQSSSAEPFDKATEIERINNAKASQIVRFSCSEIAGIAGYNPHFDEVLLLEKYIYQDLEDLRELDSENLGVEIYTYDEEIDLLLEKFNAEDRKKLKDLEKKIKVAENIDNNSKAQEFLKEVEILMKDDRVINSVSSAELKVVEEEFTKKVKMSYGVSAEHLSLDKYELLTGFPVVERNMQFLRMKIVPEEEKLVEVDPKNVFNTLIAQSKKISELQKQYMELASSSGLFDNVKPATASNPTVVKKPKVKSAKPHFFLVGKVDGVSYQLDMSSDDPSTWTEVKVVIEMKSRVRQVFSPPPIYEQIQLISYMMILNCSRGDLVQSIAEKKRKTPPTEEELTQNANKPIPQVVVKNNNEIHYDSNFSISRINLDGPPYYHSKHWFEVILPRLRSFHDAIITMRKDDGLRYSYFLATPDERREMLYRLCPYFVEPVQVDCSNTTTPSTVPTTDSCSSSEPIVLEPPSSQSNQSRESIVVDLTV